MKTQLTAVEWFNQQLVDRQNGNGDSRSRDEIFEQAKVMEKEHLYNFYMQGGVDAIMEADRNVEQYYNEKFKSE